MHKLLKFHNYLSSSCLKSILLYYSDSENLTHQNEPHTVQSNDLLLNFHWSARYYSHFTFTILFSSYLSSVKKAIIICKLWFFYEWSFTHMYVYDYYVVKPKCTKICFCSCEFFVFIFCKENGFNFNNFLYTYFNCYLKALPKKHLVVDWHIRWCNSDAERLGRAVRQEHASKDLIILFEKCSCDALMKYIWTSCWVGMIKSFGFWYPSRSRSRGQPSVFPFRISVTLWYYQK